MIKRYISEVDHLPKEEIHTHHVKSDVDVSCSELSIISRRKVTIHSKTEQARVGSLHFSMHSDDQFHFERGGIWSWMLEKAFQFKGNIRISLINLAEASFYSACSIISHASTVKLSVFSQSSLCDFVSPHFPE